MKHFATLTFAFAAAMGSAQTLHYGGDPDGRNALSSERETQVSDSVVFDDFQVGAGGWLVRGFFGHFYTNVETPAAIDWEVRRGVSQGNGGTLVAAGRGNADGWEATGRNGFGLAEVRAETSVPLFNLSEGSYWLGLSVVGDGDGRAYLATTSGQWGVGAPIGNGESYFSSDFFGASFERVEDMLGERADFSLGIVGEAVPEPASLGAIAVGIAGLAARRRRRQ